MEHVLEIIKYTLPSGVVFATAYFMLKQFLEEKHKRALIEARMEAKKQVLPIRLQAYERLILFLDRIEPNSLIIRVHKHGMSARQLQSELLKQVRNEYEHNSAQQLYVSSGVWKKVTESKDAIVQLVNLAAEKTNDGSTGLEMSNVLFEIIARSGMHPTNGAQKALKEEARQLF